MSALFPDGGSYTLKEILDKHFEGVAFDAAMAKRLYNFQLRFINLTEDHLNFFGGNLLGVQVVRFTDREVRGFFTDVVMGDYDAIREDTLTLCPSINPKFKISSDTFNLVMMYTIHRFWSNRALDKKVVHVGVYNTALLFFYRCIAALLSDWFTWPADPAVAQMAFANLDKKYLIKKLGSWSAVMDYRANAFMDPRDSIHIKPITRFDDDLAVVYAINDSQGRIRSLVKLYYAEFAKVHSGGGRIGSTTQLMIDAEGEQVVKDRTKGVDSKIAVFRTIIADEQSFVRGDLVQIIRSINKNTSVTTIDGCLRWMSSAYTQSGSTELIDEFMVKTLSYSYWLIDEKIRPTNSRDFAYILNKLKHLYLSTRIEDPGIDELRAMGDTVVSRYFGDRKVHKSLSMSTRTSIILYITLRSLVA